MWQWYWHKHSTNRIRPYAGNCRAGDATLYLLLTERRVQEPAQVIGTCSRPVEDSHHVIADAAAIIARPMNRRLPEQHAINGENNVAIGQDRFRFTGKCFRCQPLRVGKVEMTFLDVLSAEIDGSRWIVAVTVRQRRDSSLNHSAGNRAVADWQDVNSKMPQPLLQFPMLREIIEGIEPVCDFAPLHRKADECVCIGSGGA